METHILQRTPEKTICKPSITARTLLLGRLKPCISQLICLFMFCSNPPADNFWAMPKSVYLPCLRLAVFPRQQAVLASTILGAVVGMHTAQPPILVFIQLLFHYNIAPEHPAILLTRLRIPVLHPVITHLSVLLSLLVYSHGTQINNRYVKNI